MADQPSCIIEELTDDHVNEEQFDGDLGRLLSKQEGDVSKFLSSVFGFLKRRTNFFKEGEPQKRVLDAYKQAGRHQS